jgi:hypothetical protein
VGVVNSLGARGKSDDHASDLNYVTIARLRDGATLAEAEAATVSRRLAHDFPGDFREWQLDVRPLGKFGRGAEENKKLFTVAAAFLLAIACTNLAGVLIARLTRRRRELGVNSGASLGRRASGQLRRSIFPRQSAQGPLLSS